MKFFLLLSLILTSLNVFSQANTEKVIAELRRESLNKAITLKKKNSSSIIVHKLCDGWYDKVEYLKKNLTEEEIFELKKDSSATLNVIASLIQIE